jgi:hypothetical protein
MMGIITDGAWGGIYRKRPSPVSRYCFVIFLGGLNFTATSEQFISPDGTGNETEI